MSTFPISTGEPRTQEAVRHELRRRRLHVLERRQLTDSMVRVTLGGDELAGFTSLGPQDHVKAFFPAGAEVVGRDYTPSEFRAIGPSSGPELDIDFVVHGDDEGSGSGPASAWAAAAAPGSVLDIGGPRGSKLAPAGYANAVLFADGSGIPALRRWIRAFAGNTRVHAVLFGTDVTLADYLDESESITATPQGAFQPEFDLLEVAKTQDITPDTFVWAAGEATTLVPLRRWLKQELGLAKQQLSLHGYWKRGDSGFDHHAPLDPTDPD